MTSAAPRSQRFRLTRLTNRGLAVLITGAVTSGVGIWFGLPSIVLAGAFGVLAPLLGWAFVKANDLERGRNPLTLHRRAHPVPTAIGSPVRVEAHLAPRVGTYHSSMRLHGLALSALAPTGLGAGRPQRAQIRAGFAALELSYSVVPDRRGSWPLGPLFATQSDAFGFARTQSQLTDDVRIRAWAQVFPLTGPSAGSVNMHAPQRSGALDPSDEDALLRTYQPGDDLRRVHWASAARFSELMVRSNEGSSLPLAAVVLDLSPLPKGAAERANLPRSASGTITEWTVSVAASISLHLVESGHATRLISSGQGLDQPGLTDDTNSSGSAWLRPRDRDFRERILTQTIDFRVPSQDVAARARRGASFSALASATRRETVICVVPEPPSEQIEAVVDQLRVLGSSPHHLALVTCAVIPDGGESPQPSPLVVALTEAGWNARALPVGADLSSALADLSQARR